MAYVNPEWENNSTPAIDAENLNNLSEAVEHLEVANGGTGKSSFTEGAILVGNSDDPIDEVIGTGALYAQTGGVPTFGVLPVNCGGTGANNLDTLKSNMGLTNAGFVVSSTAPANRNYLWIDKNTRTLKYYDSDSSSWVAIRGVFA